MSEFRIGEIVRCTGWIDGNATCDPGVVTRGPDSDGEYRVAGLWSDGSAYLWVRPDQITRHVPAPVKPVPVGDKLASEMTVREWFFFEFMLSNGGDILRAKASTNSLLAVLDKEWA